VGDRNAINSVVGVEPVGPAGSGSPVGGRARTVRVAALIVTWNRWQMASRVLAALARQDARDVALDVVVIDNSSTDDTTARLAARWCPERVYNNDTERALEPVFRACAAGSSCGSNAGGFASLTLVRNAHNLGGCGGFNTGLVAIGELLAPMGREPEFAWLVDDDVDLPEDALSRLIEPALADPSIGLVGSRTCDIDDRARTIETTVYLDPETGLMTDEPGESHPRRDDHRAWAARVGGVRGGSGYAGVRDVDVVSACSLLARWSDAKRVGFWDDRYFIYCDDADWALRFGRAGRRVVLNLDAVVYHTPWHHKLTPARLYYAQRNLLWMLAKVAPRHRARRVLARRVRSLLCESIKAMAHRRLWHAELIRRSLDDAARNRGGRLEDQGPSPEPVVDALERARATAPGARVALMCNRSATVSAASALRGRVRGALGAAPGSSRDLRWIEVVRNDVPGAMDPSPEAGVERIVYGRRWRSKGRRQLRLIARPPRVVVVFDNANDMPLVRGGWNLHVGSGDPSVGRLERDGVVARLGFAARLLATALRGAWLVIRLPGDRASPGRIASGAR